MASHQGEPSDNCPGTGQTGHLDFRAAGDDWYVECPVCGAKWAGGSSTISPHKDRRKR